ncbi:MAG: hypothetical protein P9L88_08095 [Candidatus Tantalella remota]|nr:hypothetical protein [Candidatus Tantalella remota]
MGRAYTFDAGKMATRTLVIAVLVSLGIHIVGMSVVKIVAPEWQGRKSPYTKVDFLGPILRKTAFDIMLENVTPVVRTTYSYSGTGTQGENLKAVAPKRKVYVQEFPVYLEQRMDDNVLDFFSSSKDVPGFALRLSDKAFAPDEWSVGRREEGRAVVYRPVPPRVSSELYSGRDTFRSRFRLTVDSNGNVKRAEPVTTTGYPELDILSTKFVKGWIFESGRDLSRGDEDITVEVILETTDR